MKITHCLLAFTVLAVSLPAAAQETLDVEITPFGAYRFGGDFEIEDSDTTVDLDDSPSFGVLIDWRHSGNTTYEILYSQQQTDARVEDPSATISRVSTDIHVLQLGGTYRGDGEKVQPYLAATVGGTHVRTSAGGSQNDTFFSGSIGVGINVLPNERFGIRLEARAYGTLTDSDTDLFCQTGPDLNVCAIRVDATILSQVETFAGFTFRF